MCSREGQKARKKLAGLVAFGVEKTTCAMRTPEVKVSQLISGAKPSRIILYLDGDQKTAYVGRILTKKKSVGCCQYH